MEPREQSHYRLGEDGRFIIGGYNTAKPFSSFFPGVAGETGIPMWVFYVNRGQCVVSMGVQDKQHPIMEFLPANWACQLVSSQGFRTFLKRPGPGPARVYEPFRNLPGDEGQPRTQRMVILPSGLVLEEENPGLGLAFRVEYYNIVDDSYAGLVRRLQVRNLGPEPVSLEILDGLPLIVPYGVDNNSLKQMRRTIEAFVEVGNLERGVPFFRTKVETDDRPDALPIRRGNFYLGFEYGTVGTPITPIIDPRRVFGARGDFLHPEGFLQHTAGELADGQRTGNLLPCAMGHWRPTLPAGESREYVSIIGHVSSREALETLVPRIADGAYVDGRGRANRAVVERVSRLGFIASGEPALDDYTRQNFLDNSLRGGFPRTLAGRSGSATLHLYSRKHGDLERDYNDFLLAPTPMAQGNGNYRDVNQNRRCDLFFNPGVKDGNVRQFYDLIQLDGFNPLVVREPRYEARDSAALEAVFGMHIEAGDRAAARACVDGPFVPGELLLRFAERGIRLCSPADEFLGDLLAACGHVRVAEHGEGFWIDHWTYSLDLLENYLAFYPEERRAILFGRRIFTYHDTPWRVRARHEKYVRRGTLVRQQDAVVLDTDKQQRMAERTRDAHLVRTAHGAGEPLRSTLAVKLLCLIVNKMASLDPAGVGIEMEAGKPDWYDALNGMPGLLGSSLNVTLELKRHARFLLDMLRQEAPLPEGLEVFVELAEFLGELAALLRGPATVLEFWDKAGAAKERYRERTRSGVDGRAVVLESATVREFLEACLARLELGIGKAWDTERGIPRSYFVHDLETDPVDHGPGSGDATAAAGLPVRACRQTPLPLFLEGPVHYLRCRPGTAEASRLVQCIEQSALYDRALGMFKVNESLEGQPLEIGRARVFTPGWFENESVWLHMEYKFLLELLRNGLHEPFYRHFRRCLVPFLDPAVYGRSILENSSFIVSSANPDTELHGNGFVSRLSGATAEFIHMLMLMTVGETPFRLGADGGLELVLQPALEARLFTREPRHTGLILPGEDGPLVLPAGCFAFMFLGATLVCYHNPAGADTFGPAAVVPCSWTLMDVDGHTTTFEGPVLQGECVRQVRAGRMCRIDVELGPAAADSTAHAPHAESVRQPRTVTLEVARGES